MSLRTLFASAILACSFAWPAAAQITPPTSGDIDPGDMVRILTALGHQPELKPDDDGDPRIAAKTQGINYVILFYACVKEQQPVRCRSYQFWASFHNLNPPPTLERINEWNETKRFAQASADGQGRFRIKMNVNPRGADIDVNFRGWVEWWDVAVREYMAHIGFRK